jgi:hypothetical protein
MTKRRPARRVANLDEDSEDLVLTEERSIITNFEEVRIEQRGLDTFTIHWKDDKEPVRVVGHEIGMASSESENAKLPIYQIIEYVPFEVSSRYTRAYNKGNVWDDKTQAIVIDNVEDDVQYVKVVKAILWPGEWAFVTRSLGE